MMLWRVARENPTRVVVIMCWLFNSYFMVTQMAWWPGVLEKTVVGGIQQWSVQNPGCTGRHNFSESERIYTNQRNARMRAVVHRECINTCEASAPLPGIACQLLAFQTPMSAVPWSHSYTHWTLPDDCAQLECGAGGTGGFGWMGCAMGGILHNCSANRCAQLCSG